MKWIEAFITVNNIRKWNNTFRWYISTFKSRHRAFTMPRIPKTNISTFITQSSTTLIYISPLDSVLHDLHLHINIIFRCTTRSTLRSTTKINQNNSTVPWNKRFLFSLSSKLQVLTLQNKNSKFQILHIFMLQDRWILELKFKSRNIREASSSSSQSILFIFFTQCFWVTKKFHKGSLIKGESFVKQRIFASKCAAIYLFGS